MNKIVLFIGAITMIVTAYIYESPSQLSVGLGLMWIGASLIKKGANDKRLDKRITG